MITILRENATIQQRDNLIQWFESQGLKVHISKGEYQTVLGLVGDTSRIDESLVEALEIVERVTRVTESYKAANRKFHPEDTVVSIGDVKIGGGNFQVIAGPCSVETREQIISVAQSVKASGAGMLRGGAFKPRTSPYAFQGLHEKGLELLDTPGILWPRFDDPQAGMRLAWIGSVRDEILQTEELALELLAWLRGAYPGCLTDRYGVPEEGKNEELLERIALTRGCKKAGDRADAEKAAALILDEFRHAKLGRITLEQPGE